MGGNTYTAKESDLEHSGQFKDPSYKQRLEGTVATPSYLLEIITQNVRSSDVVKYANKAEQLLMNFDQRDPAVYACLVLISQCYANYLKRFSDVAMEKQLYERHHIIKYKNKLELLMQLVKNERAENVERLTTLPSAVIQYVVLPYATSIDEAPLFLLNFFKGNQLDSRLKEYKNDNCLPVNNSLPTMKKLTLFFKESIDKIGLAMRPDDQKPSTKMFYSAHGKGKG